MSLIEANSQQRADALAGDSSVVRDMTKQGRRDKGTGLTFSSTAGATESATRRELASGDPLVVDGERLSITRGTVSVELVESKPLGNNTFDLTLRETAEYPYVDEPPENAMGEAYDRRVSVQANGPTWTILSNEVPEGDWPLVEGAKSLGVPDTDASSGAEPEADTSAGEEPPEPNQHSMSAAAVSRNGATSYALRHALSYNGNYRRMRVDCTNFVSQALRAGGFRDRNVGHGTERSLWSWWYNSHLIDEWTHSWSVSQFNYRFHQTTSRGRVVGNYWEVTLGDVMYADWDGGGVQDHAVMFTGKSASSGLKVSMHTNDRRNVDASWWMSLGKKQNKNTDYDYFHMNYGKF